MGKVGSQAMNQVFGSDGAKYVQLIDAIKLERLQTEYKFVPNEEFESILKRSAAKANEIYWREIFYRLHFTSVSAILRSRRWVEGIAQETKLKNFFGFAATLRGLIESAADTTTSLKDALPTLAENYREITEALMGHLNDKLLVCKELEDELIHFMYARKLSRSEANQYPQH